MDAAWTWTLPTVYSISFKKLDLKLYPRHKIAWVWRKGQRGKVEKSTDRWIDTFRGFGQKWRMTGQTNIHLPCPLLVFNHSFPNQLAATPREVANSRDFVVSRVYL